MSKYYIFEIESLIQTFTVMDTGKSILFSFFSQEYQEGIGNIDVGDFILGYYSDPIGKVKVLFEVKNVFHEGEIELIKKIEVDNGISINQELISELSGGKLIAISKENFDSVYNEMISNQKINIEDDIDYLFKLGNKEFAMESMNILKQHNVLSKDNIEVLVSKKKTSEILKNSFPILIKIDNDISAEKKSELLRDETGRSRYYSDEIQVGDIKYVITNNWYYEGQNGRDTRTPYVNWIKSVISNIDKNDTKSWFDLENIQYSAPKLPVSLNYLVFGAPGTGKSHELKVLQERYFADKNSYERVTFYSNYSYPNFVGTYKPKMEGKDIIYSYVPGPFIRILEKAYKNPDKNYLLVIEEINRANPAAAFGDVFQLLDRKDGRSEYSIETSEELKLYFAKRFVIEFDEMITEEKDKVLESFSKMYIPPNMYIWATMNSADQGVYPMDTAFKRRWDYKYIGINDNMEAMQNVTFNIVLKSGEKKINWNKLRTKINEVLSGPQCRVNEDKLLGPYFISSEVMAINKDTDSFDENKFDNDQFIEAFKNKVIMYLFEDAAKQRRTEIFKGCDEVTRFSAVCEAFDKNGIEIFGREIADSVIEE